MGKMTKEALDRLTDFVVNNIGSKGLDGITYVMALKEDKDLIAKCMKVREELKKAGFQKDEVFRVYELENGYIFDTDISIVKLVTKQLIKCAARDGELNDVENYKLDEEAIFRDGPEKRRMADMKALANYCVKQSKEGKYKLEIALFSRNSVQKIVLTGSAKSSNSDYSKRDVLVQYSAFAIRHWDIAEINEKLLAKNGIKIERITPCEVLPSKTGVRFILDMVKTY